MVPQNEKYPGGDRDFFPLYVTPSFARPSPHPLPTREILRNKKGDPLAKTALFNSNLFRSLSFNDMLDHLFRFAEQHHRVVAEEEFVLYTGIARAHAALDEQNSTGLLDIQNRHTENRA